MSPARAIAMAVVACAACVENEFSGEKSSPGVDSGEAAVSAPPTDTAFVALLESCNGADDDGDGMVDEGFADSDADGHADCVDPSCPTLTVGAAAPMSTNTACVPSPSGPSDPWAVREVWSYGVDDWDALTSSASAPVVGHLNDDDGDGRVGVGDVPDLVVNFTSGRSDSDPNYLYAFDGATRDVLWVQYDSHKGAMSAIADVDGDGAPEVIYPRLGYDVACVSGESGDLEWVSDDEVGAKWYPTLTVVDPDGTGPAVIADDLVLDGATGETRIRLPLASMLALVRNVVPVDTDGDGRVEFYGVGQAFDLDGALLWEVPVLSSQWHQVWTAAVQADADPEPEFGVVSETWLLLDTDGTILAEASLEGDVGHHGAPCVADFDGDGDSEVGVASAEHLQLRELDGTLVWEARTRDISGLTGCSAFDFDGDGAYEVLYSDEEELWILDGATGAVLYQDPTHFSYSLLEYPVIADVDADGQAELVVAGGEGFALRVLEHDGDGWPAAGDTWATHDFAVTQVEADGQVPYPMPPYWTRYGVFRGRPGSDDWWEKPDVVVGFTDVCVADCALGPVELALQVGNQGASDVDAGVSLALYADDDGARRLVEVLTLPALPAGALLDGFTVSLDPPDVGTDGWVAVIDDDGAGAGAVEECDEANEASWTDVSCTEE